MAFWSPKKAKGKTYVFVYTKKDGQQKQVPRDEYKHLDAYLGDPAMWHNIQQWVDQWTEQFEGKKVQREAIWSESSHMGRRLREYLDFMAESEADPRTIEEHEANLRRHGIRYFLSLDPPLIDPQSWPGASWGLQGWLKEEGVTASVRSRVNSAVRGFFQFLVNAGEVHNGKFLPLKEVKLNKKAKATPLRRRLTPEDVMSFARSVRRDEPWLAIFALAGYFFHLRPQELFNLSKADFLGGEQVKSFECWERMKRNDCYGGLVMNVQFQRAAKGRVKPAKTTGWVACFKKEAAQLLVELLQPCQRDEPLFLKDNRKIYRLWQEQGMAETYIKDLRRASILWLAHNTGFEGRPMDLKNQARHQTLDATYMYLRIPKETITNPNEELRLVD